MNSRLDALLLFRLDGRMGRWQPVAELASHVAIGSETVRTQLDRLSAEGYVRVLRAADGGAIEAAMVDPRDMADPQARAR